MLRLSQIFLLGMLIAASGTRADTCNPLGIVQAGLAEELSERFAAIEQAEIPRYLEEVMPCLDSLDPFYRDKIAYEGTASLLRRDGDLSPAHSAGLAKFQTALTHKLRGKDPHGVVKPFAIILLAEVARTDRIHDWMKPEQRLELIQTAHDYLTELNDYRAFEDGVGFRHGVAHGADLILQLALNRAIPADQLLPLVAAINASIVTKDGTPYTTGEPGRLVRAVFYLLQRAADSDALQQQVIALIEGLADPAPYKTWGDVFSSESGLAFRHNRRAFAEALYVQLSPYAEHELLQPYLPAITDSVKTIP
ncbi:MAG: DUF2785 domain-containing protein [Pseudomonadales bacterium]